MYGKINAKNVLGTYAWVIIFYVYFVFSMSPWFVWSTAGKIIYYLLSMSIFSLSILWFIEKRVVFKNDFLVFFLLTLLVVWTFIPIRDNDAFKITLILQLSTICILLQSDNVRNKVIDLFYTSYSKMNVLFVFLWFVYFVGVPFPDIVIDNGDRDNGNFYYQLYYGVVYLNSQVINVGSLVFFRNHGFFEEPGHLGVFNLLFLSVYRKKSRDSLYKVCIFSTIITFSIPALIGIFILLFSNKGVNLKFKMLLFLVIAVLMIGSYDKLITIYDSTIGYKLDRGSNIQEILDSRTRDLNYLPKPDMYNTIFGFGREVFVNNEVVVGDYRSILYKYGVIYYVLLIVILFFIGCRFGFNSYYFYFITVSIIIVMQRSWFLDTSAYIFFLCFFYLEAKKAYVEVENEV
ncbi:hypothetical protein ABJY79_04460 [Vibrio parahaemolyticus]|uniref:hypothetical protein n=1 Tax=Vibrio parahaemolyticus TaxID=670 RepID=UPI00111F182D|nr:hypothetical protein [Vibrio parahaemolyticus]MDG2644856.1 hypothetical protein [Vibrio parahaemolyticus]TOH60039.1 hypothetical protein CGI78_13325 [Vibrio parahaemolyticus]TOO36196.1 hypothetical protein CGH37_11435 [Vibrio parahaemolyticus]